MLVGLHAMSGELKPRSSLNICLVNSIHLPNRFPIKSRSEILIRSLVIARIAQTKVPSKNQLKHLVTKLLVTTLTHHSLLTHSSTFCHSLFSFPYSCFLLSFLIRIPYTPYTHRLFSFPILTRPANDKFSLLANGELYIRNVSRSDVGFYRCQTKGESRLLQNRFPVCVFLILLSL